MDAGGGLDVATIFLPRSLGMEDFIIITCPPESDLTIALIFRYHDGDDDVDPVDFFISSISSVQSSID